MTEGIGIALHQRVHVSLDPVVEVHVGNGTVLDDFGQTGAEFASWQRLQRVEIAHHALRLVEGTDHVLAKRVVDRGLAAHRRIDLRQQRGGHLHKGHAPHVACCSEAGHVAHHATAQGEHHGLAITAVSQQGIEDEVQRFPGLVRLSIRQADGVDL